MNNLSSLEQMKLKRYIERFGEMSSQECLEAAIEDDNIAKYCGPSDPAFDVFYQGSEALLDYAILQEKAGN